MYEFYAPIKRCRISIVCKTVKSVQAIRLDGFYDASKLRKHCALATYAINKSHIKLKFNGADMALIISYTQ